MGGDVGWEWKILDCEEDEWERVVGVTAPVCAPGAAGLPATADNGPIARPVQQAQWHGHIREVLVCCLLCATLGAILGLRLWQDAEQGVALIRQDIANVVTLETVTASAQGPMTDEDAEVRSVDFRSDQAMVQVVVTRTASCGSVVVQREIRFYTQGEHGWRRGPPAAIFWGEQETLDLPRLRFIYRTLDRAAVAAVAAEADALQARLGQLFGAEPVTSTRKLTVEILPQSVAITLGSDPTYLALPSPVLLYRSPEETDTQLLARFIRIQLVRRVLARLDLELQWAPMLEGMSAWLLYSDDLPLSQGQFSRRLEEARMAEQLGTLYLPLCTQCGANRSDPWSQYHVATLSTQGYVFIEFVTDRYGLDKVADLQRGLGAYDDWDTLAPAVFGLSAEQLLAEWVAWDRQGD